MLNRSFVERPLIDYVVLVDGRILHHSPDYGMMLNVVQEWRANHARCMSNRIKIVAK